MFGLPILSIVSLCIVALIALGLMISALAEASVPFFPLMSTDYLRREMARQARVQRAQITWGMIAVGFCLLAVILAF